MWHTKINVAIPWCFEGEQDRDLGVYLCCYLYLTENVFQKELVCLSRKSETIKQVAQKGV